MQKLSRFGEWQELKLESQTLPSHKEPSVPRSGIQTLFPRQHLSQESFKESGRKYDFLKKAGL